MEALHMIKAAIPTRTLRNQIQFQPKRLSIPFCVSCSQSDLTAASVKDEEGLILKSDWRAFRAKLVGNERSPNPYSSVQGYNGEDKWAHTISEPEKGCLLVATEKLDGNQMYKRSVVLLLSTASTGQTTGLILNKPSFMSVEEMKSESDRALFFGGPLFEGLFLVFNGKQGEKGLKKSGVFDEIMNGIYYGAMESLGVGDETNIEYRLYDGYCGWEREELKDEIRSGYWTVAACSPNVVGLNSFGLWEAVNELLDHSNVC